ncbi:MAG: pyridoxal-phosphate-dependent aminotransferase family protein [Gaiellaceae bacterium]
MGGKRYLFTPGPTPVPPQVLAALAEPVLHHRGADFRVVYERCLERLRLVCRTASDVLLFTSSGTGAMESVVLNLCREGTRALVVSHGYFGERWVQLAGLHGADVEVLRYEWGETPRPDDLAARLRELGGAEVVFLTHSDTSTGVVADLQSLAAVARDAGALVAVDAVSSLGAVPVETDAWGLDAVASGSQKALMTPPGLGLCAVSARALEQAAPRTFFFDWRRTQKAQASLDAAFTPATSLIVALDVALGLLLEEGLEASFDRHVRLGRACRAGARAMGLELFSPDDDRSAVVTAIRAPAGIDAGDVVRGVRDRFGMTIANGQADLKGKVFRIGHIGWFDVFDITTALAAVELVLADLGAEIERGTAVTAALDAFERQPVA